MIDEEVRQTRCTTCSADHEYRHAKAPTPRKKKDLAAAAVPAPKPVVAADDPPAELEAAPPSPPADDEGPVHRRLIRATLPRPEGRPSPSEWKEPEFTVRQPGAGGGRDRHSPGGQRRGRGRRRGPQGGSGQGVRFGHEANGNRQPRGDVNGNRAPSGQRDGRNRGHRQRKRGR